jgi:hypothetical protein
MNFAKRTAKLFLAATILGGLFSVALASGSVAGIWHGNIRYDYSKLPKDASPDKVRSLKAQGQARLNDILTLTLNRNNKFTITVKGPAKPPPPVVGNWSFAGSSLQLQAVKDGRPQPPHTFKLAKDGKSMTFEYGPVTMKFWR